MCLPSTPLRYNLNASANPGERKHCGDTGRDLIVSKSTGKVGVHSKCIAQPSIDGAIVLWICNGDAYKSYFIDEDILGIELTEHFCIPFATWFYFFSARNHGHPFIV
jgi:hypothetical protein